MNLNRLEHLEICIDWNVHTLWMNRLEDGVVSWDVIF